MRLLGFGFRAVRAFGAFRAFRVSGFWARGPAPSSLGVLGLWGCGRRLTVKRREETILSGKLHEKVLPEDLRARVLQFRV